MRKSNIELYQKNRELTLKLYKVQCELRKIKDNSDQVVTLQREISLLHSKVCAIIDCFVSPGVPFMSRFEVAKTCLFSLLSQLDNLKKSYEQENH